MAFPVKAWVEVGVFGKFKHGGKKLVETWAALEELAYEVEWWIGVYNQWNLLEWAKDNRLLTPEEIKMFEEAMT